MTAHRNAAPASSTATVRLAAASSLAPAQDAGAAPVSTDPPHTPRIHGWSVAIATLLLGLRGLPTPARRLPRGRPTPATPASYAARDEGEPR